MLENFARNIRKKLSRRKGVLDPDEIFLDAANIPKFDTAKLEGRIAAPIAKRSIIILSCLFLLAGVLYTGKTWSLQVREGEAYSVLSENNRLKHATLFADRGIIYDRNGVELAWNIPLPGEHFSARTYTELPGLSHVLGYVKFPQKDDKGVYWEEEYVPKEGMELLYDESLKGENGLRLIETNALGEESSESLLRPPKSGKPLNLSIDAKVQSALYSAIESVANSSGFQGGAGVIMDIHTGEVIALTSFPEYKLSVLSEGGPADEISSYFSDPRKPFLDRAISGVYAPGSIVKPFMAIAALTEKIISPEKQLLSTGALVIPNPYFPDKPSVFRDWRANGWVDMRHAIAVSSDQYFYIVGGGYQDQKGLGIEKIEKYMRMFGFGSPTGIGYDNESKGTVPNPAWKAANFDGEAWLLGNTYHTSIGQYGMQVTPLQAARAVAAIANGGELLTPTMLEGEKKESKRLPLKESDIEIVREGMRLSVTEGIAGAVSIPGFPVAAKTGTAEVGVKNEFVNSWITGFFPYENPRYAFAVIMERGKRGTQIGSPAATGQFFNWLVQNAPEYAKNDH